MCRIADPAPLKEYSLTNPPRNVGDALRLPLKYFMNKVRLEKVCAGGESSARGKSLIRSASGEDLGLHVAMPTVCSWRKFCTLDLCS